MKSFLELLEKQDIEYIDSLTKELSLLGCTGGEYGFRTSGSSGEYKAVKRIEEEMRRIGLEDVTVDEYPVEAWELLDGKLELADKALTVDVSSYCGIAGTPPEGITAEIIDVGKGRACDYEGKDVTGKIVLCSFDLINDYWLNVPALQAKSRGAVGMLVSYVGDRYSTDENAIGCFDSQAESDFPIANISRKSAAIIRDAISEGKVNGRLTLNIRLDCTNGRSHNVIGYIPGESSDRYIMLGAHLDGFFNAYQDDLVGVGMHLSIAKSIIESGIKPKHTIIVIFHGSEEYGAANSRYDWCIGSYYSIRKLHPDWFGKVDVFLNFDALRPDTPKLIVNSTPEYGDILRKIISGLDAAGACWPEGAEVAGAHGPWSDEYNYSLCGIPGLICGKGPSEWSSRNYHTQLDNYTVFESEKEVVKYITELYLKFIKEFDSFKLPPFDFSAVMDSLGSSFAAAEKYCAKEAGEVAEKAARVAKSATMAYNAVCKVNNGQACNLKYDEIRTLLFGTFKIIQQDITKLDPFDNILFAHEAVADNCDSLAAIIKALENRNRGEALENLKKIDLNSFAVDFDREVYDSVMKNQSPDCDRLFWGEGRLHKLYDGYTLSEKIINAETDKDYETTAADAKAVLKNEIAQLIEIMNAESDILDDIYGNLSEIYYKITL